MKHFRRCVFAATAFLFLGGMASEMPVNGQLAATGERFSGRIKPNGPGFSVELVTNLGVHCSGYLNGTKGQLSCSNGCEGDFVLREDDGRMRGDGKLGDESFVLWFPAKPIGSD